MEQLTLFTNQTETATEERKTELRRTQHTYWNDPGHAWIEAKRSDLIMLGIVDKISGYSYQSSDRETVYLEEDCDASIYVDALWGDKKDGPEASQFCKGMRDAYKENIFIRNLKHYKP